MTVDEIVAAIKQQANPANVAGMARYGIETSRAYRVPLSVLRLLALRIGHRQPLSLQLWETGIHECQVFASLAGVPAQVAEGQMEAWVQEFDS